MNPRLELVWPNKDKFLLIPRDDGGKPVWVEPTHPAASEVRLPTFTDAIGTVKDANPHADNLLFTGDSLDALRILNDVPEYRRNYRGKVKLVYIDPPFNTGQTFTHYDDWMEHSTWLSFMRDRLLLIKDLLSPDGSLWLHLDNFETHRMRCLLDEVFGAGSYVNTVVWKRTSAKSAAKRGLGTMYDNILVYARGDKLALNPVLLPYGDGYLKAKYGSSDEKGSFQLGDLTAPGIRSGASGLPWQAYDPTDRKRHWAVPTVQGISFPDESSTQQRLDILLAAGYVQLPKKLGQAPRFKRYLNAEGGVALGDFWSDVNVINSQGRERVGYDTQKPEQLLERIISIATNEGDVVLDCFGGSGTTAAVAHKMGRRWITCEVLPATVSGFTRPRLERVATGNDAGGISSNVDWKGGGGFRTVEIGPTMYETLDSGLVLLADWATNGKFSRAVAGQLGFEFEADAAPFCGRRGRMRLAVLDGAVGPEEVRDLVSRLDDKERLTIVAKVVLPETEDVLAKLSPGSRVRKAPRDLLTPPRRRRTANTDGSTT